MKKPSWLIGLPFALSQSMRGRLFGWNITRDTDALSLVYDIRAKELEGKDLPKWMESDPQAYDPVKFLKDAFGMPEALTKPIIDEIHKPRL